MSYDKDKVVEILRSRLKDMPGLEIVLDTHSRLRYGVRFTQLLVEKPLEAYKLLVEALGGSNSSATMILQYIIQSLTRELGEAEEAVKRLVKGDDSLFKKMLSSTVNGL